MKILLVSNMYPDKTYPNYGIFVKNTEDILIQEKHIVYKIIMNKKINKISKLINYIIFYIKVIFKGYFNYYDVIYVHYASHCSIPFLILKKIKKSIRITVNAHGSDVVPENKFQEKLQPFVDKFFNIADKIIVPSEYFKSLINKKYNINNKKIFVFPSGGINTKVFYKIENKQKLFEQFNLDKNYKYIGYVGRIEYKKGWDIFLKSLFIIKNDGLLNNKKAVIVGSGKQYTEFKETVKKLTLEEDVINFNFLCQEDLNKIYNCIDVFCFPTMRDGESLGLVGIESMACGVPVIGSNIAALRDYIIDGKNGYKFIPGDSQDLSDKINFYFSLDENYVNELKKNAKKTSENYDSKDLKEKLVNILFD